MYGTPAPGWGRLGSRMGKLYVVQGYGAWSLGKVACFCACTYTLHVPVCIVLIVLLPNRRMHVYFVRKKGL